MFHLIHFSFTQQKNYPHVFGNSAYGMETTRIMEIDDLHASISQSPKKCAIQVLAGLLAHALS